MADPQGPLGQLEFRELNRTEKDINAKLLAAVKKALLALPTIYRKLVREEEERERANQ